MEQEIFLNLITKIKIKLNLYKIIINQQILKEIYQTLEKIITYIIEIELLINIKIIKNYIIIIIKKLMTNILIKIKR